MEIIDEHVAEEDIGLGYEHKQVFLLLFHVASIVMWCETRPKM